MQNLLFFFVVVFNTKRVNLPSSERASSATLLTIFSTTYRFLSMLNRITCTSTLIHSNVKSKDALNV